MAFTKQNPNVRLEARSTTVANLKSDTPFRPTFESGISTTKSTGVTSDLIAFMGLVNWMLVYFRPSIYSVIHTILIFFKHEKWEGNILQNISKTELLVFFYYYLFY
jgi:hypothetical protein